MRPGVALHRQVCSWVSASDHAACHVSLCIAQDHLPRGLATGPGAPAAPSAHPRRSSPALQLRKKLRQAFMGGPPKQPTIVHASIARLLSPQQLTREQIDRIQVRAGTPWLLRGRVSRPAYCSLWVYVCLPAANRWPPARRRLPSAAKASRREAAACALSPPAAGGVRRVERAAARPAVQPGAGLPHPGARPWMRAHLASPLCLGLGIWRFGCLCAGSACSWEGRRSGCLRGVACVAGIGISNGSFALSALSLG